MATLETQATEKTQSRGKAKIHKMLTLFRLGEGGADLPARTFGRL